MQTGKASEEASRIEYSPDDIRQHMEDFRRKRLAAAKRRLRISLVILVVLALVVLAIGLFIIMDFGCLDCRGYGGPTTPYVDLAAHDGTNNWTLTVAYVSRVMSLDSITMTIYDAYGVPLSPMIRVELSNLTAGNFSTYHVRYLPLYDDTTLVVGGRIIIEKAEYPQAQFVELRFQSYIVNHTDL